MVDKVTLQLLVHLLSDFDSSKGIAFQKIFNDQAPKSITLGSHLNKCCGKCLH